MITIIEKIKDLQRIKEKIKLAEKHKDELKDEYNIALKSIKGKIVIPPCEMIGWIDAGTAGKFTITESIISSVEIHGDWVSLDFENSKHIGITIKDFLEIMRNKK